MKNPFKDHFSGHAALYARHRPGYPDALFAYLAARAPGRTLAWDCGTGSGQAAHGLARHFDAVVATDASAAQLAHAVPHARVVYRRAPAEAAPLADGTVDLVTVAQALHWFDLDGFYAEARRVLRPDGVLAVWSYGLATVDAAVDAVVRRYHDDVVGPYWPPERRHYGEGYRALPFPFAEEAPPPFHLEETWTLGQLAGYLRSWSATQRCHAATGGDPLAVVAADLAAAWGKADAVRTVRWPLTVRVGRADDFGF